MPVPPVQKQGLRARTELLHAHQPLAVRAKSKSGRITRRIVVLTGIEKKSVPMMGIEGPELVSPRAVFQRFGILLQPHLPIGGFENLSLPVQLETGSRTVGSAGRRQCCEGKPKQNPCF